MAVAIMNSGLRNVMLCRLVAVGELYQSRRLRMHEGRFLQVVNSLTAWNRGLPEKLTGSKPLNKFPAFYGTRRFITAFTRAPPSNLSKIHFNSILPIYAWVFQVVSFPQVSPLKPCMHLSSSPYVPHVLPISVFLT